MKAIIYLLISFLLTTGYCFSQSNYGYGQVSTSGICSGVFVDTFALIANRTPTLDQIKFGSNVSLPSKCLSNMNDKLITEINKYRSQDKANIQSIINNYCSHMKGWVEYNPGTCSAGGPPPICPANHWYQNPSQAMNDYYNERNKIYNQRLKELQAKKLELMNEACNCWLTDLKQNNFKPTYTQTNLYPSNNTQTYQTTGIKIPCMNGDCPVGFSCQNGYCVESNIQSNIKNNTGLDYETQDKIADKVKDVAVDKILDYAAKKFKDLALLRGFYKAVTDNPYTTVITGVFETTNIGTYSSIYQSELTKAQANANQLEKLYEEQRRYKNNLNMTTANVQQRKNDIAKYRSELGKNIFNLNNAADGIEREKELGSCNCYNVLNYNNGLVVNSLTNIMNKQIDW